eukprot:SAG31_NODE_3818_length_3853_cov_10.567395_1_plen_112_part_10
MGIFKILNVPAAAAALEDLPVRPPWERPNRNSVTTRHDPRAALRTPHSDTAGGSSVSFSASSERLIASLRCSRRRDRQMRRASCSGAAPPLLVALALALAVQLPPPLVGSAE